MLLFSFPEYDYLAQKLQKLPHWKRATFLSGRYPNQEHFILVKTPVRGQQCVILGVTAPPDENLFSFLLLAHTLKKEGAKSITAIIPYLGYSRHDKKKVGQDLGTEWLGAALANAGASNVITLDVHSTLNKYLFQIPLHSLETASIFVKTIRAFPPDKTTFIAPDEGAIDNCEALKNACIRSGMAGSRKINIAFFKKRRTTHRVALSKLYGTARRHAVIVDDILDTGETIVECAKKLYKSGVRSIYIIVSHGLFTGQKWKKLWSLGVRHIYCTDSVPFAKKIVSENITVVSAAETIIAYFKSQRTRHEIQ